MLGQSIDQMYINYGALLFSAMDFIHISKLNPWWKDPSTISNDAEIKEFDDAKIQWIPRIKHYIKVDKDKIYTLRGPRQVGKTTLVKILIRDLLKGIYDSKSIFYYTCDLIANEKELFEVINLYLDWASAFNLDRKYIVLDEISAVKDWEKGLKYLVDAGFLINTSIILTGSHSIDIKQSIERLPGRRGEGSETIDKILMPMKFAEFAETINPTINKLFKENHLLQSEKRQNMIFKLFDKEVDPVLNLLQIYQDELDTLFEQYLITGGIIKPINQFFSNNSIDNSTYEIYIRSLIGDLARWQIQEISIKQILRSISNKLTTNISWHSIAKETDIVSHNTVSKYVGYLEDSFVLSTLYPVDITRKVANYKKEKKIYFQDPFIFHSLRSWVLGQTDYFNSTLSYLETPENKSKLVESIVENHLIRFMYNVYPSDVFTSHEHIFYWRKKGGKREVDFIIKSKHNDLLPIELKYQNKIQNSDYKGLHAFNKGILISKNKLDVSGNYVTIPVSIFLLLI